MNNCPFHRILRRIPIQYIRKGSLERFELLMKDTFIWHLGIFPDKRNDKHRWITFLFEDVALHSTMKEVLLLLQHEVELLRQTFLLAGKRLNIDIQPAHFGASTKHTYVSTPGAPNDAVNDWQLSRRGTRSQ